MPSQRPELKLRPTAEELDELKGAADGAPLGRFVIEAALATVRRTDDEDTAVRVRVEPSPARTAVPAEPRPTYADPGDFGPVSYVPPARQRAYEPSCKHGKPWRGHCAACGR